MGIKLTLSSLALGAVIVPASSQVCTIRAEAPATVQPGETFELHLWASFAGESWVEGESVIAGFGFDVLGSGSIEAVSAAIIDPWAAQFGNSGVADGTNVHGISGGQLPLHVVLPPPETYNYDHPAHMFIIEVVAGNEGTMVFEPGNPNVNGALSFYPNLFEGAPVIAPNDPGTILEMIGTTTRIVPAPSGALLSAFFAGRWQRRRR